MAYVAIFLFREIEEARYRSGSGPLKIDDFVGLTASDAPI